MRVRDAVEADGEALGDLADAPAEVMRNVVHDRTVRVAERPADDGADTGGFEEEGDGRPKNDGDEGPKSDDDEESGYEVMGFVGFDAMPGTVRVTYLRGSRAARERLLDEPIRFARKERMSVEVLVPEDETTTTEIVENAGFQRAGTGPRFEGGQTFEYRLDPTGK